MGVSQLSRRQRKEPLARRAGLRVAASQEKVLERVLRVAPEERLAAIYRREAVMAFGATGKQGSWLLRAVAVAAAACAVVAVFFVLFREPALQYEVAGRVGTVGEWVAADGAAVALDFSDGSGIQVQPGARARVAELGDRRAGIMLERGQLHVHVVPRERNAWFIAGGPFQVHVVGTEFDVGWDADAEKLSIRMVSGRVRIEGPCIGEEGRMLSAPESIQVTCAATEAPVASVKASATASSEPLTPPTPPSVAPIGSIAPAVAVWQSKLRAGDLRTAFVEAQAQGLDSVLGVASAAELVDLGSAARLAGKPAEAVRIYQLARNRSPGTDAAATAAYHLGRMAFDGRGAWAEAEKWFSVYLSERPGGKLAAEALGRSIECADKRGDADRARSLAAAYLRSYPKGAHASLASSLVDTVPPPPQ